MAAIEIRGLAKRFGATEALRPLDLEVADGEFVTLLGPSGCGKTTTLRLLAGFLRPDQGAIRVGGELLSSASGVVPPERRGMGMVFQSYAVWPHITVHDNVAFGLQVRRMGREEVRRRVGAMLELVGLGGLERRYPAELSGGQQQRVALARSLVVEPRTLLLDEPLSNLDAKLRERMRWELKQLQRRTGITFVYVTHDQAEAMALSDRIAVLHEGELLQYAAPREVYERPSSRTVADFMGLVNLLPGRVVETPGAAGDEAGRVAIAAGPTLPLPIPPGRRVGDPVQIAIRPEHLRLERPGPQGLDAAGQPALAGRVRAATFLGNLCEYQVALDDGTALRVQAHPREAFEPDERILVRLDLGQCTVFG